MTVTRLKAIAVASTLLAASGWFLAATATAGEVGRFVLAANDTADAMPDPAQIGRGAKAWADTCQRCHNLRDPNEFSDKNWSVIVNHMRVIAPLPGQEAEDIKAFLKASN
jgi:cytochrome c5